MTEKLYNMLIKRFPPIHENYRISIYEAYERIYLSLSEREFAEGPIFDSLEKIDNLASKLFDVNFRWGKTYYPEPIPTICFDPIIIPKSEGGTEKMMEYGNYYDEQSIEIKIPFSFIQMTINTGNRGVTFLHPKQRQKYFDFVVGVHGLFIENANRTNFR